MKINKINNTSFGGIYKIKNTPENLDIIMNTIIPAYKAMRNKPITLFPGENPFQNILLSIGIKIVAEAENCTEEWVRMNAENNGINIGNAEKNVIHVITGNKDCSNLLKYLHQFINSFSKSNLLKSLKLAHNISQIYTEVKSNNIPEHLIPIVLSMHKNEQETKKFQDAIMKGRKIEISKNINELTNAILMGD